MTGALLVPALVAAFLVGSRLGGDSPQRAQHVDALGAAALRSEVLLYLRRHYYRPLPRDLPRHVGVPQLLAALDDPYTQYLSPRAYRDLRLTQAGQYAGVGLAVVGHPDGLAVTGVMAHLPARVGGVRVGDVITHIDGARLAGVVYARRLARLRGAAGSEIAFTIRRAGRSGAIDVVLERRAIDSPAVLGRILRAGGRRVLHLRVVAFPDGAAARVRRLAARADAAGAAGVVLDLRGNPGGLLPEAVATARVFLPRGVIVTTVESDRRQVSRAGGDALDVPVVVLVDGGTASAAEVLAGALRPAAPLVGSRTFGKGTVQAVYPLSNGGALKVTAARLVLAGGVRYDGRGIGVDVRAADRAGTRADEALAVAVAALPSVD